VSAGPERSTYVVRIAADDIALVAVDLTEDEAELIGRIADTLNSTGGAYSGTLSLAPRPGGGADRECAVCSGTGRCYGYDEVGEQPCEYCVPTAVVDRSLGGAR
jgi:hypothetical protein